jgi:hypothetical protein
MLSFRRNLALMSLLLAAGAAASSGCVILSETDSSTGTPPPAKPIGPEAKTAAEAWPNKGTQPPALTNAEIASGCAVFAACSAGADKAGTEEALLSMDICVGAVVWAAERAIPISNLFLGNANERPEFFVRCALDNVASCDAALACLTTRTTNIYCEEDGCRLTSEAPAEVTCEGDVAKLTIGGATITRDCSRSFTKCDAASETGCTDRPFTACVSDDVGRSDHCDGNVRLGCDGAGQVSYRDCERLGGVCGAQPEGDEGCNYGDGPEPECSGDAPKAAACAETKVSACVNGKRVTIEAAGLCSSGG